MVKKILLFFVVFIFTLLIFTVIIKAPSDPKVSENSSVFSQSTINSHSDFTSSEINSSESSSESSSSSSEGNIADKDNVKEVINNMTLEEKVGQLFVIAFKQDASGNNLYALDDYTRSLITNYHVGGVILFSENISSIEQVQSLIGEIQSLGVGKLFVSVDQEGGVVNRFSNLPITQMPGAPYIGDNLNPELSLNSGKILGRQLSALGFNIDFAPVADLNGSYDIADRSFGSDPNMVSELVSKMVEGIQSYNVAACIKHFPGIGSGYGDTHNGMVESTKGLDELLNSDLIPFKGGINSGVDMVLVSHVTYNNLYEGGTPASLTKNVYDVLRGECNFKGVTITDALNMGAIVNTYTQDTPSLMAFEAGSDLLLIPDNLDVAYNDILNAVKSGRISEERLNESLNRILVLKEKLKILNGEQQEKPNLYDDNDGNVINEIYN